jgi:hypothetical protein
MEDLRRGCFPTSLFSRVMPRQVEVLQVRPDGNGQTEMRFARGNWNGGDSLGSTVGAWWLRRGRETRGNDKIDSDSCIHRTSGVFIADLFAFEVPSHVVLPAHRNYITKTGHAASAGLGNRSCNSARDAIAWGCDTFCLRTRSRRKVACAVEELQQRSEVPLLLCTKAPGCLGKRFGTSAQDEWRRRSAAHAAQALHDGLGESRYVSFQLCDILCKYIGY